MGYWYRWGFFLIVLKKMIFKMLLKAKRTGSALKSLPRGVFQFICHTISQVLVLSLKKPNYKILLHPPGAPLL